MDQPRNNYEQPAAKLRPFVIDATNAGAYLGPKAKLYRVALTRLLNTAPASPRTVADVQELLESPLAFGPGLTAGSLASYRSRVKALLDDFIAWHGNIGGFVAHLKRHSESRQQALHLEEQMTVTRIRLPSGSTADIKLPRELDPADIRALADSLAALAEFYSSQRSK